MFVSHQLWEVTVIFCFIPIRVTVNCNCKPIFDATCCWTNVYNFTLGILILAWAGGRARSRTQVRGMLEIILASTRWHCEKMCWKALWLLWKQMNYSPGKSQGPVLCSSCLSFCSDLSVPMYPLIHHCQEGDHEWFISNDESLVKFSND